MRLALSVLCSALLCSALPGEGAASSCLDQSIFDKAKGQDAVLFEGIVLSVEKYTPKGKKHSVKRVEVTFDVLKWRKGNDASEKIILRTGGHGFTGRAYPYEVGQKYLVVASEGILPPYISPETGTEIKYYNINCRMDGAVLLEDSLTLWQRLKLHIASLF